MGLLIAVVILTAFIVVFRHRVFDSVTMRNLKPLVIFLVVVFIALILASVISLLR